MADIEFVDNTLKVNKALDDALGAFLLEASGEIVAQTARRTPVDMGQLKGSWKANVDESEGVATIGSDLENAIWNEFGTGEYAAKHNGRKGGWYIHESKLSSKAKSRMKRVEGKDGKVFYFTLGKKPQRSLENGYNAAKGGIVRRAEAIFSSKLR